MIARHGQTTILHRVVEHQGVIYLAGITADDRATGMGGQTTQILDKAETLLRAHGSDRTKILTATIYITEMAQKDAMNAAWTAWFGPSDLPARATIGVAELGPGALIEIVITAAK
jgi:enamine deaminase RidA (YjgF/YER057c/UK114 family)